MSSLYGLFSSSLFLKKTVQHLITYTQTSVISWLFVHLNIASADFSLRFLILTKSNNKNILFLLLFFALSFFRSLFLFLKMAFNQTRIFMDTELSMKLTLAYNIKALFHAMKSNKKIEY